MKSDTFFQIISKRWVNKIALLIFFLFVLCAVFAPFLASSQPILVIYDGSWYSPLIRSLFFTGSYPKVIDRFYNMMIFTLPIALIAYFLFKQSLKRVLIGFLLLQTCAFAFVTLWPIKNPVRMSISGDYNWQEEVKGMSPYARLQQLISRRSMEAQQKRLAPYTKSYLEALSRRKGEPMMGDASLLPTQWNSSQSQLRELRSRVTNPQRLAYLDEKERWIDEELKKVRLVVMPLIRPYGYQEDVGGNQLFNQTLPWYELSRTNRRDLTAALIFGIRISLLVGIGSVAISLLIGITLGAVAGYFGGKLDLALSRLLEVWEGMPTLFMLLMLVAITESKSVAWIIFFIGIFGWTGIARYVRSETLKIRPLAYIQACKTLGYSQKRTLFYHLLPNALSTVITLLPFAIMSAIVAETGLSFLGLGEEGSASWGVLMDEGRRNFPAESALLWPPAILITILLSTLAILGDALRDALDPRLRAL